MLFLVKCFDMAGLPIKTGLHFCIWLPYIQNYKNRWTGVFEQSDQARPSIHWSGF